MNSNSINNSMPINPNYINKGPADSDPSFRRTGSKPMIYRRTAHSVHYLTKTEIKDKLGNKTYVPLKVLERFSLKHEFISIRHSTAESMRRETTAFGKVKPAVVENLKPPPVIEKPQPFPKESLTRMLTGDVKPEWLVGLGRMKKDQVTPEEGYKDCFVSSLGEYQRKGINFEATELNNPVDMAEKLDLKPSDTDKIRQHGAWLIEIHPSFKLAIPTERKNEWNPEYVEGGYTGSGQQEWVTPNVGLDSEARAGRIKIYKLNPDGKTIEWKFFQGKLYPNIPNDKKTGSIEGSYNFMIDTHIKSLSKNISLENRSI